MIKPSAGHPCFVSWAVAGQSSLVLLSHQVVVCLSWTGRCLLVTVCLAHPHTSDHRAPHLLIVWCGLLPVIQLTRLVTLHRAAHPGPQLLTRQPAHHTSTGPAHFTVWNTSCRISSHLITPTAVNPCITSRCHPWHVHRHRPPWPRLPPGAPARSPWVTLTSTRTGCTRTGRHTVTPRPTTPWFHPEYPTLLRRTILVNSRAPRLPRRPRSPPESQWRALKVRASRGRPCSDEPCPRIAYTRALRRNSQSLITRPTISTAEKAPGMIEKINLMPYKSRARYNQMITNDLQASWWRWEGLPYIMTGLYWHKALAQCRASVSDTG